MNVNFTLPNMPKTGKKHQPDIFIASAFFVLAMSGQYIASFLVGLISSVLPMSDSTFTALTQLLYYVVFMIAPILLFMRRFPISMDTARINPLSGRSAFLCVLIAIIGVLLMNIVSSLWLILIESMGGVIPKSNLTVPKTSSGLVALLIFVAVLPGVSEELLFRGMLLGAWEEKGTLNAMIISSAWFTFYHGAIQGMPNQFLSGLILAFVVVSTDSVIAGMIYHTVNNSLTLIFAFMAQRSLDASGIAEPESASMLSAMGGYSGIVSLLLPAAFLGGMLIFLLKKLDKERLLKKRFTFGYPSAPHRDFSLREYAVIGSGFAIVCMLYLTNFLEIVGWIY